MIGVQLMGLAASAGWAALFSSLYFFAAWRLGYLRLTVAEQVIGMDAIENAAQAGIDISNLKNKIERAYPKIDQKRCC